jgi:anti-sigma factor RsiW
MTPEEFDELLGAYALDAVDGDERDALEAYLATNPRARDEVAHHREVASMLGYTGAPAPAGLWDRIAGALDDRAPAPSELLAPLLDPNRAASTATRHPQPPRRRVNWMCARMRARRCTRRCARGMRGT